MGNKVTMDVIAGVNVDSTGLIVNASAMGTGVCSSMGVNFGKVYFEVDVVGNANVGLCDKTMNLNSTGWPTNASFVVQAGSLDFYIGRKYYAYTKSLTISSNNPYTIGFALDMDAYILNIYFNGVLTMDSFLLTGKIENLGTTLYPFLYTGGGTNTGKTEWNFGATPFKYPIPEGYTSYDGNQSNISRYLLKNDEGYKNLTEFISTEIPTEDQFKEKGMSDIPSYSQLSNFNDLVTYTTGNLSKSLVKFKPKAKTVLSSGAINFSGKELKKVSLIGTDNARVLFSKDRGVTWHGNVALNKIPIVSATSNSTSWRDQTPDKAIDGDINTLWQVFIEPIPTGQTGHELILDIGKNMILNNACIITCNVGSMGSMGVKNFEVYGATNNTIKQELLYAGVASNSFDTTTKETLFTINSKKAYRYYIFNFKESYNGTNVVVLELELYGSTPIPISDISTQGITPTQLSAITPEEWKTFMRDSSTLRFAYYLPDETANTDKLELTVDFIGE